MDGWKLTSAKVVKVYLEICLVGVGILLGFLALSLLVSPAHVEEHGAEMAVEVGIGAPAFHPRLPLEVGVRPTDGDAPFTRAGLVDGRGELRAVTHDWSLCFLSRVRLVLGTGVLLWIFWILRSFLRTVIAGEPFHAANSRRLRTIGLLLIGLAGIAPVVEYLLSRAVLERLTVEGPVLSPALAFSKEAFVVGLVFLVFASVFHHGTALEEERALTV